MCCAAEQPRHFFCTAVLCKFLLLLLLLLLHRVDTFCMVQTVLLPDPPPRKLFIDVDGDLGVLRTTPLRHCVTSIGRVCCRCSLRSH
jgi:hypothetical protein